MLGGVALAIGLLATAQALAQERVDFRRDVRPILARHCFKCHGPDAAERQASLRLDTREGALAEADSGEHAIVPGKPDASELVRRILADDESMVMPPPEAKSPLTDAQKETLKRWIAEGAEYQPHWAFEPPQRSALPHVKRSDWPVNAIDYFVLARLEAEGLAPSAPADRYTLVRRVYLDLIGLPPTPEEADAFVNDHALDAYERLVDRLLASPAYGERWARKWLDLARYADTNGYEKDRPRSIWPYRDWVIRAINADMPFDQFTIEQLAGDMLPDATLDQRIATGFHRNTMLNEEGGIDPLEFRYYAVVDRLNTTATTWLGLTLACAQCHTHKFDPIPHREYYAMMAFLNNTEEPELSVPQPELAVRRDELLAKIARLEAALPDRFNVDASREYHVAHPAQATATGGATLTVADDGAVMAGGENPATSTYNVAFSTERRKFVGLRVEALTDSALPSTGPGRTPHGNFVLTNLKLRFTPDDDPEKPIDVKLVGGAADHEQNGFPAAHAIDDNPRSGWAIQGSGKWNVNRAATFSFEQPIDAAGTWTLEMAQDFGTQHTLGKFRISLATEREKAGPPPRKALEQSLAAWIAAAEKDAVRWQTLRPRNATSNLPLLTILDDHSILASGDQTKRDVYQLTFDTPLERMTAVRLEALPDERLPKGGPGRIYYEGPHGDFFLSTVTLQANGQPAPLGQAFQSFASGGNTAAAAIDDNPQTGWSINGRQGEPHVAVFVLKEPLANVRTLDLSLVFERYYAAGLGRFRISVTGDDKVARAPVLPASVADALATAAEQRTREQQAVLRTHYLSIAPELAAARKEIEDLKKQLPQFPTTLVMTERPRDFPRPTHRMHRGEFLQPKEEVTPDVLSVLSPWNEGERKDRLGFARWLVDRKNPLTARVTVNRHWHALFGRGLVRTTEDFGLQGELPSHPELLDYLAVEFMEQGWSVKQLHRLIVTSSTYRQSSHVSQELLARDPQNILLARGARFRLEAEPIRDSALRISGLLSRKIGGPSVFPPQPPGVTTEGAYGALAWNVSPGEDRYRRGLYTFAKRTTPFAMLTTFDGPTGEACLPRRESSNTPLQALMLLNDEVFLEAARALGSEFAARTGADDEKAKALFRRVLIRPPTESEREHLTSFITSQRERLKSRAWAAPEIAGKGEGDAIERATWTLLARALLNLDETVSRE